MAGGALYLSLNMLSHGAESEQTKFAATRAGQHMGSVLRAMGMAQMDRSVLAEFFLKSPEALRAAARQGLGNPYASETVERLTQVPVKTKLSVFPAEENPPAALRFWTSRALATELFTEVLALLPEDASESSEVKGHLKGLLNEDIVSWALATAEEHAWDKPIRLLSSMVEADDSAVQAVDLLFSKQSLSLLNRMISSCVVGVTKAAKRGGEIGKGEHIACSLLRSITHLLHLVFSMTYGSTAVKMSTPMPIPVLDHLLTISNKVHPLIGPDSKSGSAAREEGLRAMYSDCTRALVRLATKHHSKPVLLQRLPVLRWVDGVGLLKGTPAVGEVGGMLRVFADYAEQKDVPAGGAVDAVAELQRRCGKDGLQWVLKLIDDSGSDQQFVAGLLSCIKAPLISCTPSSPGMAQLAAALKPMRADPPSEAASTSEVDSFNTITSIVSEVPAFSGN